MPLALTCRCGNLLDIDAAAHGKSAQCPVCGNVFVAGSPISTTTAIQDGEPDVKSAAPVATPEASTPDVRSIEKRRGVPPQTFWVLLVGFLLIGVGMWTYVLSDFIIIEDRGPKDIARIHVKSLSAACDAFRIENNRWPRDLKELTVRDVNGIVYVEDPDSLIDPWGKPYQYDANGRKNDGWHADIWTLAPDGQTIGNWPRRR